MRKIAILIAFALPLLVNAMKITKDEIDEFSGNRIIETSWETLASRDIRIRFRLADNKQFLDFKYYTEGLVIIDEGDELKFKSQSDSIISLHATQRFRSGIGQGATGNFGADFWGIHASYTGDMEWFADNVTRLIRIYSTKGYFDKKISESDGRKLVKLYNLFSKVVNGRQGSVSFASYNILFLTHGVKSSDWTLVKKEYKKDITKEELDAIVKKWESGSDETRTNRCQIIKAD